jgi:cell wall-associated NlpC family hydrolase
MGVGGVAGAAPQPTVASVQAKLTQLNNKAQTLDEQFDQAQEALASASQQLKLVNQQAARYQAEFNARRKQVAQIAAQAYEQGTLDSPEVLLTTNNPQQILNQSSILLELSSSNTTVMKAFISAAKRLTGAQEAARRTKAARAALATKLAGQKKSLNKTISQQKALLAQLTPAQQTATGPSGGQTVAQDPLPATTQALKAVQFAYDKLGCPYVFGGTGPCSAGYDCSGLTSQAWAAAGVSIPRTSYEQMSELPAVSTSELQPGDILGFIGNGHVGIYVGNGYLIDAPQTGENVEKVRLAGWFLDNLDGAVRP